MFNGNQTQKSNMFELWHFNVHRVWRQLMIPRSHNSWHTSKWITGIICLTIDCATGPWNIYSCHRKHDTKCQTHLDHRYLSYHWLQCWCISLLSHSDYANEEHKNIQFVINLLSYNGPSAQPFFSDYPILIGKPSKIKTSLNLYIKMETANNIKSSLTGAWVWVNTAWDLLTEIPFNNHSWVTSVLDIGCVKIY